MNLVGKLLANRYEIVEEIGVGGMAVVYKARCRVLNRYVAIKVLRDDLKNDEEFVKRFNIEAQSAASLTHHNIVSVFDVGTDAGLHYIVMEYVEGPTLKEYIDKKRELPWREAVDIAMQICKGLEVAHKNSIVHRDIKPHNIMRTEEGVIKVTDFGIARANVQETMTAEDSAIGSVHYISPEQARGGFIDHRSDIYSLGIVLYEMLTGRVPFDNESPVTIAIKHIQEAPVPPCEYNISIPIPLEQAVLKAISKEPIQRYKNVSEFCDVLRDILEDPQRKLNSIVENSNDETKIFKAVEVATDETVIIKKEEINRGIEENENNEKKDMKLSERKIDKNKERKVIIFAILSSIVVIFGLLFALASLMGITDIIFSGGATVEVPEIVGMSYEKAVETYSEYGFNLVISKEIESEKKEGEILNQTPNAKERIKKTEEMIIKVDISAGLEKIILDSYLKYTDQRTVEIEIKKLGLKAEFIEEASDEIPKGAIIRQVPGAGVSVTKGELITFYVSTGPDDEKKPENSNNTITVTINKNDSNSNNTGKVDTSASESTNVENNSKPGNNLNSTDSVNKPPAGNTNNNTGVSNENNTGALNNNQKTEKKSSTLTVYGPKDKESANVQVKANGRVVFSRVIKKGSSEAVRIESSDSTVEVEILYDGVSMQKGMVTLH